MPNRRAILPRCAAPALFERFARGAWPILVSASLIALLPLAPEASAQVGTPDPTFDVDGIVTTDVAAIDRGHDVVVQQDGTIAVVGSTEGSSPSTRDGLLLRYASDGGPASSHTFTEFPFGCVAPEALNAILEEGDGRLVLGGVAQNGCSGLHERDFWLLRVNADGSGGQRFTRPVFSGNYDEARALALQADGKIVAAGTSGASSASNTWDFGVARFDADGTLDDGFGTAGEVLVDFAGDYDSPTAVAMQADGRIVVAGFATDGDRDIALVRLLANGDLDPTFDDDGIVITDFAGFDDGANDLAVLADGRLVVAGWRTAGDGVTRNPVVVRYDADGAIDATFNAGGVAVVDFGLPVAAAVDLLVQHDDKLVVAGYTETGTGGEATRDFAAARLHADGTLDTAFDGDGLRVDDLGAGQEDVGVALALQPVDGHLVVAGYTVEVVEDDELWDVAVLRLVGDAALLIFADGFEGGDDSAWSP